MMMMITTIIIMIITIFVIIMIILTMIQKDTFQDSFSASSLRLELSETRTLWGLRRNRAQITCN